MHINDYIRILFEIVKNISTIILLPRHAKEKHLAFWTFLQKEGNNAI